MQISIHTSAREVTAPVPFLHWKKLISIHTSAREVTNTWLNGRYRTAISIHTSAREVTVFTERSVTDEIDFNPHFRKGRDIYRSELCYRKSHFNPHFRKGSDFPPHPFTPFCYYFNPHFRKGSDEPLLLSDPLLTISIHTSAREVTMLRGLLHNVPAYFNPHFRKGSDKNG